MTGTALDGELKNLVERYVRNEYSLEELDKVFLRILNDPRALEYLEELERGAVPLPSTMAPALTRPSVAEAGHLLPSPTTETPTAMPGVALATCPQLNLRRELAALRPQMMACAAMVGLAVAAYWLSPAADDQALAEPSEAVEFRAES